MIGTADTGLLFFRASSEPDGTIFGDAAQQLGAENPFYALGATLGQGLTVSSADFDDDGALDVIAGDNAGRTHYLRNDGAGRYAEALFGSGPEAYSILVAGGPATPLAADLDGDGDVDLLIGMADGKLAMLLNTGNSTHADYVQPAYEGDASCFALGMTADGVISLLGQLCLVDTSITTSTGGYAQVAVGGAAAPAAYDLDGDGDLDLAIGAADGSVTYYESTLNDRRRLEVRPSDGAVHVARRLEEGAAGEQDAADRAAAITPETPPAAPYIRAPRNPFGRVYRSLRRRFNGTTSSQLAMNARPTFVDVNSDGYVDLLVGVADSRFYTFLNRPGDGSDIENTFVPCGDVVYNLDHVLFDAWAVRVDACSFDRPRFIRALGPARPIVALSVPRATACPRRPQ